MSTSKAGKKAAQRNGLSHAKLLSTSALVAIGLAGLGTAPAIADDVHSWSDLNQVGGSFNTDISTPDVTNIKLNSSMAIGEGNATIYADDTVNVDGQLFVVRDNRMDPTYILGKLNSNGEIIVIDTNGVFFGKDSVVNVGSIVASTGDIANEDIMDGDDRFTFETSDSAARIEMAGTINVAEAGLAAFVSPTVVNSGVINAQLGTVAFGAAQKVTLDMYGDGLVEVAVDGELADALLENKGAINAQGGKVQISALAAKNVVDNIINVEGVVNVASATQQGGKIILSGGSKGVVNVAGKLDASGENGGSVIATGQNVNVAATAEIKADGGVGGNGGVVGLWADSLGIINGRLSARGGLLGGDGGFIETSGFELAVGDDAIIDASASFGESGLWLIDPLSIVIGAGGGSTINVGGAEYTLISNTAISTSLSSGTSVTIETGFNSAFSLFAGKFLVPDHNDGDILVRNDITHSGASNSTLTLIADGDISIENGADISATGKGELNLNFTAEGGLLSDGDIFINNGSKINTNGGDVTLTARDDIRLHDTVNTAGDFLGKGTHGGNVNLDAGSGLLFDGEVQISSTGAIITTDNGATAAFEGNVLIEAEELNIDTTGGVKINAADGIDSDGTVTITRSSNGSIGLGNGSGDMQISQAELSKIDAENLVVGGSTVNQINVENVNTTIATISNLVSLITGLNTGNNDDVNFAGTNVFNALKVSSNDDIVFAGNASVETLTGDAKFTGDENNSTVGDFIMGTNSKLDTNGNNIDISVLNLTMNAGSLMGSEVGDINILTRDDFPGDGLVNILGGTINADGGNIVIDNQGVFFSQNTDSVRTNNGGTIDINQWVGGSIQNAAGAIFNTGTGQNTVHVGAGTFDETLQLVGQNNMHILGSGQGVTIIAPTALGAAPALTNGSPWNGQLYTPLVLAQNADNVDFTGITVDGSAVDSGTTAGLAYYNAGGKAENVTITNGGAFGFYAVADGTQGHSDRTVEAVNVTSSGNSWAALAVIGNKLNTIITGGNYNGTGGSDALDLSNGSRGSVTGATLTAGTHSDQAGISFHGGHDWTITNVTIKGNGTGSTGIADDGTAYGVAAASNINIVGGTISNVGTGIDAIGGSNWDVDGTTITAASAGVGTGIHYKGLLGGNVNTIKNVNVSNFNKGIHNDGSNGTQITGGTFTNNTTGTLVNPSSDVVIDGATYTGGVNGVVFSGGNNNTVKNSKVNTTTGDGIVVSGSTNAKITSNEIGLLSAPNGIGSGAGGGDAIFVTDGDGAIIKGNKTANTNYNGPARKGSGILVVRTDNAVIGGTGAGEANTINLAGSDGIVIRTDGDTANNNQIVGNKIIGIAGSRTGIYTENATNTLIDQNEVSGSGRYAAIYGNGGSNFTITKNIVVNNEEQGIRLENVAGTNLIKQNTINDTGNLLKASDGSNSGDAIYAKNVAGLTIESNSIGYTTLAHTTSAGVNNVNGNGITVLNSPSAQVKTNWITEATGHGIHINPSPNSLIQGNDIKIVDGHGINVAAGNTGVKVDDNDITGAGLDGIHVEGSSDIEITKNKIYANGTLYAGAGGKGIYVKDGLSALIKDNEILGSNGASGNPGFNGSNGDGIHVNNNDGVEIDNNWIKGGNRAGSGGANGDGGAGAGGHGIYVTQSQQSRIVNNDILSGNIGSSFGRISGVGAVGSGIYAIDNAGTNTAGKRDGIYIGYNVIDGNSDVDGAGVDGIFVQNSAKHSSGTVNTTIEFNTIDRTGEDGIDVRGTNGAQILSNTITNVDEHGIRLNPSHNALINLNTISGTGLNGITVLSSNNVDVTNNKLHDLGQHGIYAETSNNLYVFNNTIGNGTARGAAVDGIHVNGGRNAEIDQNTIQGGTFIVTAGAGNDGIHVVNNREAVITDNIIKSGPTSFGIIPGGIGAVRHGIYAENSGAIIGGFPDNIVGQFRDGVRITGNQILNNGLALLGAGADGIHVINSAGGLLGDRALVELNTVRGVGSDGIYVTGTNGVQVLENTVSLAVVDGIRVENSDIVEIIDNDISLVGQDGIELLNSDLFDISLNTVNVAGANGILATNVTLGTIDHNTVTLAGANGISLLNGDVVAIDTNTVTLSGNDGISVIDSNLVDITNNNVSLSGRHGIFVDPSFFINVIGNVVALSGVDGIHAEETTVLNIENNIVTLSGDDGIDVINSNIVNVDGNTITLSGNDGIAAVNNNVIGINNNIVTLSGDDGIDADTINLFSIDGNTVTLSGEHGIELADGNIGTVNGNLVTLSGVDGINADGINLVGIEGNTITLSGDDGIDVDGAALFSVNGNIVMLSGDNGIEVSNAAVGTVNGNIVTLSGDDGIDADDIALTSIDGNIVTLSGDDGIDVDGAALVSINGNFVSLSGDNGIELSNALLASVDGNIVTLSGDDGIDVEDVLGLSTNGNVVSLSGDDGIDVRGVIGYDVSGNIVTLSSNNGIELSNAALGGVKGNIVSLSGNDGINANNIVLSTINGNIVTLSGGDGIDVNNAILSSINGNIVTLSGNNGIELSNGIFVYVNGNIVTLSGNDGINVDRVLFSNINGNIVTLSGNDGIDLDDSLFTDVNGNIVTLSGDNGIEVTDSLFADINKNIVTLSGDDGIHVEDSWFADINGNTVTLSGNDGIYVFNGSFADINNNNVTLSGDDGIQVAGSSFVEISGNDVWFAGDDGIDLSGSFFSTIDNNTTRFVLNNGIEVTNSAFINISSNDAAFSLGSGIFVDPSWFINVSNNHVHNNVFGVYFDDVHQSQIVNNTIENNLVGIRLENSDNINVADNTIANNFWGLWAGGGNNGYINVENNVFLDNPVHALFQSGLIDLTGIGNQFLNGNIALYFSPFGGDASLLALVDDDAAGFETLESTGGAEPSNYGGTIGKQYFKGQTDAFVKLDNNAFTTPGGEHIWLNGLNSTYFIPGEGDFTPATFGGVLTQSQYNFLESMFDHYPDTLSTGIFFFGAVPDNFSIENFEDFMEDFGAFASGPTGLRITLTGLPSLGNIGSGPLNLNAIAPAAGGEESGNVTLSAADPADLANIEPAAGPGAGAGAGTGNTGGAAGEAACWGDAVNMAGAGTPVNFDFGGTFEESIAAAAGCGSQSF